MYISGAWWCVPVVPTLKQEDLKFKATQNYTPKPHLKKRKTKKNPQNAILLFLTESRQSKSLK